MLFITRLVSFLSFRACSLSVYADGKETGALVLYKPNLYVKDIMLVSFSKYVIVLMLSRYCCLSV